MLMLHICVTMKFCGVVIKHDKPRPDVLYETNTILCILTNISFKEKCFISQATIHCGNHSLLQDSALYPT